MIRDGVLSLWMTYQGSLISLKEQRALEYPSTVGILITGLPLFVALYAYMMEPPQVSIRELGPQYERLVGRLHYRLHRWCNNLWELHSNEGSGKKTQL